MAWRLGWAFPCGAIVALSTLQFASDADPFAFFQPSVSLTIEDRQKLDRGQPIARVVSSRGREVAAFAAVPIDIDADRLVAWMRRIDRLKKSAYVQAIGRFSDPPSMDDLAGLVLDDEELSDLRACQPTSCPLKLTTDEVAQLQRAVGEAGEQWRSRLEVEFRAVLLRRVAAYLASGLAALRPYAGDENGPWPAARFSLLLGHSLFLRQHVPRFVEHLARFPDTPMPEVETFVYWSKERMARKAIISATHVSIVRLREPGLPEVLVAGKGIFATHYVDASLGLTALLDGSPEAGRYLAYLNRSEVDVLGGAFGGLVRWFVQRRLKTEARSVLQGLKHRLESGDPP